MNGKKLLSIITVNYNGFDDTCALIDSIPAHDQAEVIVVDNGSRRDEAAMLALRYPDVKTIRSDKNLGFAGGNNLGIKAAEGEYLFFVNNDTLFPETDDRGTAFEKIALLIRRIQQDPQIGMVCPKIRFAWGSRPIQFTGYTPLKPIVLRNHAIGFGEEDHGQYETPHPTPYAHGAAMLVSRQALNTVGLMPECYFLYYEELDWSMMFTRQGYAIWYDPAFTIYHKESQATGQDSALKTYYITRNRLLFAKRNQPFRFRYLTYAYLIGVVAVRDLLKHTLRRRSDLNRAVFSGIRDFFAL